MFVAVATKKRFLMPLLTVCTRRTYKGWAKMFPSTVREYNLPNLPGRTVAGESSVSVTKAPERLLSLCCVNTSYKGATKWTCQLVMALPILLCTAILEAFTICQSCWGDQK